MNIKAIILSAFFALLSPAVFAGAGHDHGHDHGHGHAHAPVTQQQAEVNASRIVSTLVNRGVIDETWADKPVKEAQQKNFGGQMEWVISYANEAVSDPEKRTLYIFLTLAGEYIAANYTGK